MCFLTGWELVWGPRRTLCWAEPICWTRPIFRWVAVEDVGFLLENSGYVPPARKNYPPGTSPFCGSFLNVTFLRSQNANFPSAVKMRRRGGGGSFTFARPKQAILAGSWPPILVFAKSAAVNFLWGVQNMEFLGTFLNKTPHYKPLICK